MKTYRRTMRSLLALTVVFGLASCGGGADSVPVVAPTPPPPPQPVVFSDFVKTQFDQTADDTNPREVDDTDFAFDSLDDPTAFDDLLANP